jgi:CRP/FNR family transcriptional regulator, cyclic AMP receptor protein
MAPPMPNWSARAQAVGARAVPAAEYLPLLSALWASGPLVPALDDAAWTRLAARLHFVRVRAGCTLIEQDEPGDFLLVLLDGSVRVEHRGREGAVGLSEARPGDVLGEMALLDAGPRSSACLTRTDCLLAVLEMPALEALMRDEPHLAASLMAALARRLSLRLRQTDARLLALLSEG